MAESPYFRFISDEIEKRTSLNGLQARGAVRLAVKVAGLPASDLTKRQAEILVEKLLPAKLRAQGLAEAEVATLGTALLAGIAGLEEHTPTSGPGAMLDRLDRAQGK